MTLRKFSIFFLIFAVLLNAVMMKYQINEVLHDLTRLCVIVAFVLLIVSFFRKKKA